MVGICFVITIYYILELTGPGHHQLYDPSAIAAVIGTYFFSTLGYLFWKRLYIDHESRRVTQLTGQLKSTELLPE